jgi:hypothetical protein
MGPNESKRREDFAACAALNYVLGGQPSESQERLMVEFGYWRSGRLTEAGEVAAGDASGMTEGLP